MKPIEFDGMVFDADALIANRQVMISIRDTALDTGNFAYAIAVSHTVAVLAKVIEDMGGTLPEPPEVGMTDWPKVLMEFSKGSYRKVTEMYGWFIEDDDGNAAPLAHLGKWGVIPLFCFELELAEMFRTRAQEIANKNSSGTVILMHFKRDGVVSVLAPKMEETNEHQD